MNQGAKPSKVWLNRTEQGWCECKLNLHQRSFRTDPWPWFSGEQAGIGFHTRTKTNQTTQERTKAHLKWTEQLWWEIKCELWPHAKHFFLIWTESDEVTSDWTPQFNKAAFEMKQSEWGKVSFGGFGGRMRNDLSVLWLTALFHNGAKTCWDTKTPHLLDTAEVSLRCKIKVDDSTQLFSGTYRNHCSRSFGSSNGNEMRQSLVLPAARWEPCLYVR